VQLVRNTPLLIQMYIIYFGFSMAGIGLSGFNSGLLALVLQNGGYVAEIYRGGLQAVSFRQYEAGRALGMRRWTLYRTVILPQVIAKVIPPLTNQAISILKDTTQVAAIAVMDVMKVTQVWVESSANTYHVFFGVAVIYLVLTSITGVGGRLIERWLAYAQ
jgi:polar amino acid transport system permease protein